MIFFQKRNVDNQLSNYIKWYLIERIELFNLNLTYFYPEKMKNINLLMNFIKKEFIKRLM